MGDERDGLLADGGHHGRRALAQGGTSLQRGLHSDPFDGGRHREQQGLAVRDSLALEGLGLGIQG